MGNGSAVRTGGVLRGWKRVVDVASSPDQVLAGERDAFMSKWVDVVSVNHRAGALILLCWKSES